MAKPEHSTEFLLLSWSKDLKLGELRGGKAFITDRQGNKNVHVPQFLGPR